MIKKLLSLFLVCLFSIGIIEAIETSTDPPAGSSVIVLYGELDYNAGPNSVEAYYNSNMVVVCFHQNFGCVNIILIGEGNTIYNGNVNTAVQQTVYIPIAGAPSGSYTLILSNVTGMAEGDFEK